jgi:uncharacterized protein (TIGR02145 family)
VLSFKTIAAICMGAMLSAAQTINISGFVQDSSGLGISGATVKLVAANKTTTTGVDGSFKLISPVSISTGATGSDRASTPIWFCNGKITIALSKDMSVEIGIYDVRGREVYGKNQTYGAGTHSLQTRLKTAGIYLFKVSIGKEAYTFKYSPLVTISTEGAVVLSGASKLAKGASASSVIDDIISSAKEGYLNYRESIKTSDTSGLILRMIRQDAGTVTDIDGNVYHAIRIGNQVWMRENLWVTKYNDGTAIPWDTSKASWIGTPTPKYCFYNNTTIADSIKKYGGLYNWYVVSPTNPKKIAPAGWHVPSSAEWDTLEHYLVAKGYNWDGTTMWMTDGKTVWSKTAKSLAVKTDWKSYYTPTIQGTPANDLSTNNASGFSAFPSGDCNGSFFGLGYLTGWWSATERSASNAWACSLWGHRTGPYVTDLDKAQGYSLRLLRD